MNDLYILEEILFTVRLGAQLNQWKPMSIRKCSRLCRLRRRKASKKAIDVAKFKARVQINALTRTKADIGPALHSSEWKITNGLAFDKARQVHKFPVPQWTRLIISFGYCLRKPRLVFNCLEMSAICTVFLK